MGKDLIPSLLGRASSVNYDNTISGLTADNIQEGLDELALSGGSQPYTSLTDPALNSITTNMIDTKGGVSITLTGAGNNQTLPNPTDTSIFHKFTVINNATSTNNITIIGSSSVILQAGEKVEFIYDGDAWIASEAEGIWLNDGTDVKTQISRNIDLQDKNLKNVDDIKFNLSRAGVLAEGELGWNDDDKTLEVGLAGGNVNLQLGQEQLIRAKAIGSNIDDGKAVYISGATGAVIEASLVSASDYSNACKTIAISTQDVLQNGFGYFTTFGLVRGLDTNSFTEGDILWLGENGNLVNIEPTLPNCPVRVGYCLRKSATVGVIFVNIEQKESLTEREATKEPTGFVEPQNVDPIYNNTTRKVTLGGTNLTALWRNVPISAIVAGEIDLALPAGITTTYYLQWSEVGDFEWTNTFDVSNLYITSAVSDGTDVIYCLRECHGLMQWQSHRSDHLNIGTYRISGGDSTGVVLDSTTATERRPIISDVNVIDEDLPSVIAGVSSTNYTRLRLDGAGADLTFDFSQTEIVNLSTNQPYYNQFTGGAWQETLLPNNNYMSVWVVAIPTTSDSFSTPYRLLFVQGQSANANLGVIQAETPASVNLGILSETSPEYVFIQRYIVQFLGGNWRVVEEDKIEGSRSNQVVISGITGLSAVAVNANNLEGNGTVISPLSMVEVSNTFGIETKTLDSFDKTLGNAVIYDYVVYDGTNSRAGVLIGNWNVGAGTSASISDSGSGDIGDTTGIDFDIKIVGDNVELEVVSALTGFTISGYRRIL